LLPLIEVEQAAGLLSGRWEPVVGALAAGRAAASCAAAAPDAACAGRTDAAHVQASARHSTSPVLLIPVDRFAIGSSLLFRISVLSTPSVCCPARAVGRVRGERIDINADDGDLLSICYLFFL
jgi:hypothetical protein